PEDEASRPATRRSSPELVFRPRRCPDDATWATYKAGAGSPRARRASALPAGATPAPAGAAVSTYVIGDVHGERAQLERVLDRLPFVAPDDTLVLLGDYVDRGPDAAGVIARLSRLPEETAGKVVLLRGNHEDVYLRSLDEVDVGFFLARGNGVLETFRS